jgi:preprotein translocase subunit SecE
MFIFYVLIDVEECIVSSFKIEEFYNADMSASLLRKIGSFVSSQKAAKIMYRFTLNFFRSTVKETADIIFPAGYFYHSLYTRTVFGVLSCLNIIVFNGVINS